MATAIQIEGLSKSFSANSESHSSEQSVFSPLSISVQKGDFVGIYGANGSGKSTLLKMLAGVIKPTTGKALVYGRSAAMLDTGSGFHTELSGFDNIFLYAQLLGFRHSEIRKKRDEIIAFSGIENHLHRPVKFFSNGMYVRLAFSIVAHLPVEIYLFDEILGFGDTAFRMQSIFHMKEWKKRGGTLLFATHDLSLLHSLSDYVCILPSGQISQLDAFSKDYQIPSWANTVRLGVIQTKSTAQNLILETEVYHCIEPDKIDFIWVLHPENPLDQACGFSTINAFEKTKTTNQGADKIKICSEVPLYMLNQGKYNIELQLIYNQEFCVFSAPNCASIDIPSTAYPPFVQFLRNASIRWISGKWHVERSID